MLVTEHQTAGRGRLDRAWETPARSSLTFSVLLRPDVPAASWPWLPLLTGYAVQAALARPASRRRAQVAQRRPRRRRLGRRKVCGILVERVETPDGPVAVVGIGINVDQTLDELPVALATSVSLETGEPVERTGLLGQVLGSLHGLQGLLDDVDSLRRAYADVCVTLGRTVDVHLPAGDVRRGEALDIDASGALVVGTDDGTFTVGRGRRRARPSRLAARAPGDMIGAWPFPSKLLNPGEHVVVSTRLPRQGADRPRRSWACCSSWPWWCSARSPTPPVAGGARASWRRWWPCWFVLRPFVKWLTTTYTFTNRRFIKRSGFIAKEGRTIPLNRISGVDFEIGVDRPDLRLRHARRLRRQHRRRVAAPRHPAGRAGAAAGLRRAATASPSRATRATMAPERGRRGSLPDTGPGAGAPRPRRSCAASRRSPPSRWRPRPGSRSSRPAGCGARSASRSQRARSAFTAADTEAVRHPRGLRRLRAVDFDTAVNLTRGVGQTMARLADWEVATLVSRVEEMEAGAGRHRLRHRARRCG